MHDGTPFKGPLIQVWAKKPASGGMLENASMRQLGTRTFLVGQLADFPGKNDSRTGLTYWFPIEDVLMIVEYPNITSAVATWREWMERKNETPGDALD